MQDTKFCAPCALWRLGRGEDLRLVLADLPANPARIGHPICEHHYRMLKYKPHIEQVHWEGMPQFYCNGVPITNQNGIEIRDMIDQIDLVAMVRGDAEWHIEGILNVLYWRRWQYQHQQWEREYIDQQSTTMLPAPHLDLAAEQDANDRMFERIKGYLALKAAGLDTGEVNVINTDKETPLPPPQVPHAQTTWPLADFDTNCDDPDDRISGEE